MSRMEIDQVLSQIRALRTQGSALAQPPVAGVGADKTSVSFASVLRSGIEQVNSAQQKARETVTAFEMGKPGVELPQAMLEMQKASISFRAAVEVRNKLVSAYQEIMNMPV